jgi:hypothetical protein
MVVAVIAAACDKSAGHAADGITERPAPAILQELSLPDDAQQLSNLFDRLPQTVADRNRLVISSASPVYRVAYGEHPSAAGMTAIQIIATDVKAAYPNLERPHAAQIVMDEWRRAANSDGPYAAGRDHGLYWLYRPGVGATLIWGRDDSPWVYAVSAPNDQQLQALLVAVHVQVTGYEPACLWDGSATCLP